MPSPWWSSWNITNVFLSRTKNVGAPWLGRSVTSGRARQAARTLGQRVVVARSRLDRLDARAPVGPEREARVVGDLPQHPVGVAEVGVVAAERRRLRPLHDRGANRRRQLDDGVDLVGRARRSWPTTATPNPASTARPRRRRPGRRRRTARGGGRGRGGRTRPRRSRRRPPTRGRRRRTCGHEADRPRRSSPGSGAGSSLQHARTARPSPGPPTRGATHTDRSRPPRPLPTLRTRTAGRAVAEGRQT